MVTESPGIWRRERECQLALAVLTNLFLPPQKALDNLFLIPLCHIVGSTGFVLLLQSSVEMGQAHVHKFGFLDSVHTYKTMVISECILQRQKHTHKHREKERDEEDVSLY